MALTNTIRETAKFLGAHYGLTPQESYSLSSVALDYRLQPEAVDLDLVMYATIPKALFRQEDRLLEIGNMHE